MYSMQDLISEIATKVDNLRSLGASDSELKPDWIAQDILNDHPDDGVDEFIICAARATVRKEVLRYLGRLEPENEEPPDFTGRSPEELEAMAEGCREHAEELRWYLAARRAARRSLPLREERAGEDSP
jgi:hypothetical protein